MNTQKLVETIHTTPSEFLRVKDLARFIPFSTPSIWRKSRDGEMPKPYKLSKGITAWKTSEIREWLLEKEAALKAAN